MSLYNTRSAQNSSAAISYLGYLQPDACRGMILFSAPERYRFQWSIGSSRGCGISTAGVGLGTGVNFRERVFCAMGWTGTTF